MSHLLAEFLKVSTESHHESQEQEFVDVVVPETSDVTVAEEVEAEDHLDEIQEERRDLEAEEARLDAAESEVKERLVSIEQYTDVLSFGLEKGQFSPQFAARAHDELQHYKALFGDTLEVPAMEDYSPETMGDYYTASLEGFGEVSARLKASVTAGAASLKAKIEAFGTNEKAADALIKKADAALGRLAGRDFNEAVTIKLGSLGKVFVMGGKSVADPVRAIGVDQAALGSLYKSYAPKAGKYASDLAGMAREAMLDKKKAPEVIKRAEAMKHPRTTIAPAVADGGQLLARKVKPVKDNVVKVESEGKFFIKQEKGDGGEVTLSKSQVESLLKGVKVYAEQLRQLSREAKKELKTQQDAFKKKTDSWGKIGSDSMTAVGPVIVGSSQLDGLDREIFALARNIRKAAKEPLIVYKAVSDALEDNAKAVLKLAERASSAAGGKKEEKEETADKE